MTLNLSTLILIKILYNPFIVVIVMEKILNIEWMHVGDNINSTCERCAATGRTLAEVIDDIRPMLSELGIKINVKETVLSNERIGESNKILFNGISLEKLISDVRIEMTSCPSCSCMTGTETECRAIVCDDMIHEAVPAELIRRAALKAIGI